VAAQKKIKIPLLLEALIGWLPVMIIGLGGIGLMVGRNENKVIMQVQSNPFSTLPHWSLAMEAADSGDRQVAEHEYELGKRMGEGVVLGAATEVEDKIYEERKIKREMEKLEQILSMTPSRDVYEKLASYYAQMDKQQQAKELLELARKIDPNE